MPTFRPFCAVRPVPALAEKVAALPYDTMNSAEAKAQAAGNPYSFLHVDKAEIDLPADVDVYSDIVYQTAAKNLRTMIDTGVYRRDAAPQYYIYRQTWRGKSQTGLVGCASIDDYQNEKIKKHELTRADKEADRIAHVTACNANTGPIFLLYKDSAQIDRLLQDWIAAHPAETSFCAEHAGGARQEIWPITDAALTRLLGEKFAATDALYIADGHHRCASAAAVGFALRAENAHHTGGEEYNFFLAVAFPDDQLTIMDYNRVVQDLNGYEPAQLLSRIEELFAVEPQTGRYIPEGTHTFGMYLDGVWYKLRARKGSFDATDPVASLDVEILQQNLLAPLLGIKDPRRDTRIKFVGGIRGHSELEKLCAEGAAVAFAMYPTTTAELMAIADSGNIMPPKSTWFEPKLLSGLFVHELS